MLNAAFNECGADSHMYSRICEHFDNLFDIQAEGLDRLEASESPASHLLQYDLVSNLLISSRNGTPSPRLRSIQIDYSRFNRGQCW